MNRIRRIQIAAACAAAALAAPAAHACSLAPFPASRDGVHLIGTATADTLLAGVADGEYARVAGNRPIYGQVVRVERLGGTEAAALPAGTGRVVLVPWGYGGDCLPMPHQGSAAWAPPGERGLFWAALRPRDRWVNGLPTLDVGDPYQLPYARRAGRWDPDSLMTVDQAFELIGLLPRWDEIEADPEAAHQPLLAWARAHPGLARLYPAAVMVGTAQAIVRHARLARIDPPLGGTYEFAVTVNGQPARRFYARTRAAPAQEWRPRRRGEEEVGPGPAPDDPIEGYSMVLVGDASADSLPAAIDGETAFRQGYAHVLAAPATVDAQGVEAWRGTIELSLAARQLPGDSVLARVAREDYQRYARLAEAGEPEEVLARFLRWPDGHVTVEQTTVLDDGTVVVLAGERISRVTIPEPDDLE